MFGFVTSTPRKFSLMLYGLNIEDFYSLFYIIVVLYLN